MFSFASDTCWRNLSCNLSCSSYILLRMTSHWVAAGSTWKLRSQSIYFATGCRNLTQRVFDDALLPWELNRGHERPAWTQQPNLYLEPKWLRCLLCSRTRSYSGQALARANAKRYRLTVFGTQFIWSSLLIVVPILSIDTRWGYLAAIDMNFMPTVVQIARSTPYCIISHNHSNCIFNEFHIHGGSKRSNW